MKETFETVYELFAEYRKNKKELLLKFFETNDKKIKRELKNIRLPVIQIFEHFVSEHNLGLGIPNFNDDDAIFLFLETIHSILHNEIPEYGLVKKSEWEQFKFPSN